MKLRNAPSSILVAAILIAAGAVFNFVLGLLLSLAPESLDGIEAPTTANGAPKQLTLVAGVACIAFGFVFLWILKSIIDKSQFAIVMIYTLSLINILFGLFRMPLGLLTISLNVLVIFLVRTNSAKHWFNSPS
jgi:Zn-dependent protease with chaperone function